MDNATIEKYVKFIIRGFLYAVIMAVVSLVVIKIFDIDGLLIKVRYFAIMGFYAVYLVINVIKDKKIKQQVIQARKARGI